MKYKIWSVTTEISSIHFNIDYFHDPNIFHWFYWLSIDPSMHHCCIDRLYNWFHVVYSQYSSANIVSNIDLHFVVVPVFLRHDTQPHNKSYFRSMSQIQILKILILESCWKKTENYIANYKIVISSFMADEMRNSPNKQWFDKLYNNNKTECH